MTPPPTSQQAARTASTTTELRDRLWDLRENTFIRVNGHPEVFEVTGRTTVPKKAHLVALNGWSDGRYLFLNSTATGERACLIVPGETVATDPRTETVLLQHDQRREQIETVDVYERAPALSSTTTTADVVDCSTSDFR